MKCLIFAAVLLLGSISCGGRRTASSPAAAAAPAVEPGHYTYSVKAVYPHPADRYTQGLQYVDGTMWEGTGMRGESAIYATDMASGRTRTFATSPRSEFGEGITVLGDKLYQLTWTDNKAHLYDLRTGNRLREFRYKGEGWGLTSDGRRLYMSDGTSRIRCIEPENFNREAYIEVTLRGEPLEYLNELEWIEGRIWANVYTTDAIVIIDPATGIVEGLVDLRGLLAEEERTKDTDVLNGIAYDAEGKRIFVTGKRWSKIFEIEITEQ